MEAFQIFLRDVGKFFRSNSHAIGYQCGIYQALQVSNKVLRHYLLSIAEDLSINYRLPSTTMFLAIILYQRHGRIAEGLIKEHLSNSNDLSEFNRRLYRLLYSAELPTIANNSIKLELSDVFGLIDLNIFYLLLEHSIIFENIARYLPYLILAYQKIAQFHSIPLLGISPEEELKTNTPYSIYNSVSDLTISLSYLAYRLEKIHTRKVDSMPQAVHYGSQLEHQMMKFTEQEIRNQYLCNDIDFSVQISLNYLEPNWLNNKALCYFSQALNKIMENSLIASAEDIRTEFLRQALERSLMRADYSLMGRVFQINNCGLQGLPIYKRAYRRYSIALRELIADINDVITDNLPSCLARDIAEYALC